MIIVTADDWGRTQSETDAALRCYQAGRITAISAMVFMEDSMRAAALAKSLGMVVGLHLNLTQPFTGERGSGLHGESHRRIVRFLTVNKYALLVYNPFLRKHFRLVYQAQVDEFVRLYGQPPTHFDGHQHMHLCANILVDKIIPDGVRVRRNFSFIPGEKSLVNRAYRRLIDSWLARRHRVTDYFFSLGRSLSNGDLRRVIKLAESETVEVMTHPVQRAEYECLLSEYYLGLLRLVPTHVKRNQGE